MIFYLAYFVFSDYRKSRENRLAQMFDESLNDGGDYQYAKKTQTRVVLIMYRGNGRGGIQGIMMDIFYVNKDGRIANEFYIVTDNDEGEIKRIEQPEVFRLQDNN